VLREEGKGVKKEELGKEREEGGPTALDPAGLFSGSSGGHRGCYRCRSRG
jgi:hypothetical protein